MSRMQRLIFRERARNFYWQRQQPDVLPRFISSAVFFIGWALLLVLLSLLVIYLSALQGFLKG